MSKLHYIINNKKINHYHFPAIDSTQTWAKSQIQNFKLDELNVFSSGIQTNGLGQHGRKWLSSNKPLDMAVTYGFLCDKKFAKNKNLIPHVTICSVLDLLLSEKIDAKIKWVNDLLICKKKICGILTESLSDASILEYNGYEGIFIGIGINVNSSVDDFVNLENKATSMRIETQKKYVDKVFDIEKLIVNLTSILLSDLDELFFIGFDKFRNKINSKLERFEGRKIVFRKTDGGEYIGYIKEVGRNGELIMADDNNEEQTFVNGRIIW